MGERQAVRQVCVCACVCMQDGETQEILPLSGSLLFILALSLIFIPPFQHVDLPLMCVQLPGYYSHFLKITATTKIRIRIACHKKSSKQYVRSEMYKLCKCADKYTANMSPF